MVGKKGYLYLAMTILLLSVVIGIFALREYSVVSQPPHLTTARVLALNSLALDIERDLERSISITGFRSFLAMTQWETANGRYVDDVENSFQSIFYNGSYNGTAIDVMSNNTFGDWVSKFQEQALRLNALLEVTPGPFVVYQDSPWTATIDSQLELSLLDLDNDTSWHKNLTYRVKIDLEGLEDPLYALETEGALLNQIRKAGTTDFVTGTDVSALAAHANASYYVASTGAPSYLMRLEGNLSPSPHGIESLVNIDELEQNGGLVIAGYDTVVDYLYFGRYSGVSYSIPGMPEWFALDEEEAGATETHLTLYEVDGLV